MAKGEKQAETTIAKGTVTKEQAAALDRLIGSVGSNQQDVVGKILTMWLYQEGHMSHGIRKAKKK